MTYFFSIMYEKYPETRLHIFFPILKQKAFSYFFLTITTASAIIFNNTNIQ